MKKYQQCPCCDYFSIEEHCDYEICPVCFWEDDGSNINEPDRYSHCNHMTLREGRSNFKQFGACEKKFLPKVVPAPQRTKYKYVSRDDQQNLV